MKRYLIAYLRADFTTDPPELRPALYAAEHVEGLLSVARRYACGFRNERGEFVLPAAVLMVSEVKSASSPG